jgi:hypothetical protein
MIEETIALFHRWRGLALSALTLLMSACAGGPSADEIEAARKTIDCEGNGQRILVRFEEDEARVLMPDGVTRVILYQVSTASGIRFLNGDMELRGTGADMQLIQHGDAIKFKCKQYEIKKQS